MSYAGGGSFVLLVRRLTTAVIGGGWRACRAEAPSGMRMSEDDLTPFRRLVARIAPGAELIDARRLTGGVSAEVTAVTFGPPGGETRRVVVRRHGPVDLAHNPHAARDEFRLMEIARAHGLPVPEPVFLDASCDLFPAPVVVVGFVDGAAEAAPRSAAAAAVAARQLARIHAIPASADLAFLRPIGRGWGERPDRLDDSMDEGRIRDALEGAWPLPVVNPSSLLHGDFWPGNLLWRNGELAAVIDWEDARTGDPLSDLGNARFEWFLAHGAEAMTALTAAYRSATRVDLGNLAYWDLRAALRPCGRIGGWGLEPAEERRLRAGHAAFVTAALSALAGQPAR